MPELSEPHDRGEGSNEASDIVAEDVEPRPGLSYPQEIETPRDATRKWLAYALVFILLILVVVGCVGWLRDGSDADRMQNFSLLFAPIVTLLGTILGFYFSSGERR